MQKLVDQLNYYTKLYDEGNPEISDATWDQLYFMLQRMEKKSGIILSDSPTNKINYYSVNNLNKVTHNHPMASLAKTKNIEEIKSFVGDNEVIAMLKMDGLTCSITYQDGQIVRAETRGNGEIGEDITHNIKTVKGIPVLIPIKDEFIVDGEIICTYEDFKQFSNEFANPRNFAAGSIRLLDNRECATRHLTFIAWDCIKGLDEFPTLGEKLTKLDEYGFKFCPFLVEKIENNDFDDRFSYISNFLTAWGNHFSYPYDGLVFKYNDCNYYSSLGMTAHHPRSALAFKFYDEEYETYLKDIEYTMGKTGILTPVAIFEEVDTGDSIISRASVHNLNIMKQILGERPYIGQKIWVCKQNEIIPQIVKAEKENYIQDLILDIPKKCPCCGADTFIKDDFLYCSNKECEGKLINKLDHFVGKKGLDIKGLSKATLQKLINWEWVNSISDIFELHQYRNEWYKKDGFGVKSVDNILEAIENSKECELWQFISALSIPLIGSTYAKEIARRCAGWLQFMECVGPHMIGDGYNFMQWNGFGFEMDKSLHSFDYTEANELVSNVLHLKNSLWINPEEQTKESNISGKNFVITGKLSHYKNRDELVAVIEAAGGKVVSSVSKNTNYLVNNDINSTSSKNIKAKSLGIPIITEEQLLTLL